MSYRVGSPIAVGRTVYMHGTRSVAQAVTDWPRLLVGAHPLEQQRFEALSERVGARRVVGHSLGAAWAHDYVMHHPMVRYRGYGRPAFGLLHTGDVANLGDPVTWFGVGPHRWALGHSLAAYRDK
nr:hypothetical protein [Sobelivirales sp.]